MRAQIALLVAAASVAPALAQTAAVAVSHDDPDGVVAPGETVRITAWHTRSSESTLAGIGGDLLALGDLGVATNPMSALRPLASGSTYQFSLGAPSGGSVRGISFEFLSHPNFVPSVLLPYQSWGGVELYSFDWTAPSVSTPTTVNFDWVPSTTYPNVYAIIPPYSGFHWAFLPTTYTGASVLVLPAPATLALLLTPALVPPKRRHAGR